jgi:hypothetical protein
LRQLCVGESCLDIFRKLSPENEELVLRIGNEFEQYSKEMTNNPDYKTVYLPMLVREHGS